MQDIFLTRARLRDYYDLLRLYEAQLRKTVALQEENAALTNLVLDLQNAKGVDK